MGRLTRSELRNALRDQRTLLETAPSAIIVVREGIESRLADSFETALKLAVCIDHNTAALNECAFELRRFQERKEA